MSLTLRIFVAYCCIVGLGGILLLNSFVNEIKPSLRQATEDSLIDTANILAEFAAPFLSKNSAETSEFATAVDAFLHRKVEAEIYSIIKRSNELRIYLTDENGMVIYDSAGLALGEDYSRWNDVYLTLRGQYGARSTKADPNDDRSSVMHVAAPIRHNEKIVGVVTVARPNYTSQKFIDNAYRRILTKVALITLLSLAVAMVIAFLLTRSVKKLVNYADQVSHGNNISLPKVYESELASLGNAIENMKVKLEGKAYVEQYVHGLTHELKSPISAIKGASELLGPNVPADMFGQCVNNIETEITRMDAVINRLLELVTVEQQQALKAPGDVELISVTQGLITSKQTEAQHKSLTIELVSPESINIRADALLIRQAIDNLLQNAIDFAQVNSVITVEVELADMVVIRVYNKGPQIPDFALDRIFERFYSLPRPNNNRKSNGLGLCFVKQIAELHAGRVSIKNRTDGVQSSLFIPAN